MLDREMNKKQDSSGRFFYNTRKKRGWETILHLEGRGGKIEEGGKKCSF